MEDGGEEAVGAVGEKLLSGIDELGDPAAVGSGGRWPIVRRRMGGSPKGCLPELAARPKGMLEICT